MFKSHIAAATFAAAAIASTFTAGSVASAQSQTTLVGCVYEEKNIPSRAPNPAERIGIGEDYILAEISPAEAAKPTGTSGGSIPTTYSMYKLEKTADSQLKSFVGKRVEVVGKLDAESGDLTGAAPASAETNKVDKIVGHDRVDLPEFEVTSIKAIAGTCPARPSEK